MNEVKQYETVIGLEVHVRLMTKSKLFCADANRYGDEPNSSISPITLAHPGTLPRINKKAIEYAVRIGLATGCEIEKKNYFARKNYFYPDLPKGYQISQHTSPICKGGSLSIQIGDEERKIRLNRIHLEEDAGKSIHDLDEHNTLIDYNRAGTPLVEIVTEPDLRSGEEAFVFLDELRKLVRYLEISDGNMEEGSLRCDANVSVRLKGENSLGVKVEVKNLNSMRNVRRAIEYESGRIVELIQSGHPLTQETRGFDADKGISFSTREKEDADDYRYFPDPDLPMFHLDDAYIRGIRNTIPILHRERIKKYVQTFQLPRNEAEVLTAEKEFSNYFENLAAHCKPRSAANWLLGPVRSWLNANRVDINEFPIEPLLFSRLVNLVDEGNVSFTAASGKLFDEMIKDNSGDPFELAKKLNLLQESDQSVIEPVVEEVLSEFATKVNEYKKGKKGLLALFVGEVMKRTKGKADPLVVNKLILEKLKSS